MITIEEVQAWNSWANGKDTFKPHSVNKLSLADLALSQHEEIERLRDCIERALPLLRGHVHGIQHALMCESVLESLNSTAPTNEVDKAGT